MSPLVIRPIQFHSCTKSLSTCGIKLCWNWHWQQFRESWPTRRRRRRRSNVYRWFSWNAIRETHHCPFTCTHDDTRRCTIHIMLWPAAAACAITACKWSWWLDWLHGAVTLRHQYSGDDTFAWQNHRVRWPKWCLTVHCDSFIWRKYAMSNVCVCVCGRTDFVFGNIVKVVNRG